jgi:hypothetical protein
MKKIITAIAMAFGIVSIQAQTAQVKIKVREGEIPISVIEAFRRDFQAGKSGEWAIVPAAIIEEEYVVSSYNNMNGQKPTSYTVVIKGPSIHGEAVYDQSGKLKYSKEIIRDTALPKVVRDAVIRKYPDYMLIKDQETIKEGKSKFIHYRVIIEKGRDKKALAVDASGKISKEKKVRV